MTQDNHATRFSAVYRYLNEWAKDYNNWATNSGCSDPIPEYIIPDIVEDLAAHITVHISDPKDLNYEDWKDPDWENEEDE